MIRTARIPGPATDKAGRSTDDTGPPPKPRGPVTDLMPIGRAIARPATVSLMPNRSVTVEEELPAVMTIRDLVGVLSNTPTMGSSVPKLGVLTITETSGVSQDVIIIVVVGEAATLMCLCTAITLTIIERLGAGLTDHLSTTQKHIIDLRQLQSYLLYYLLSLCPSIY